MKFRIFILAYAFIAFLTASCTGDMNTDMVKQIQPIGDRITINAETFHIRTETVKIDSILSNPDSTFLLGRFNDKKYGYTEGDLLTQFYYVEKFNFLDSSIADAYADSVFLNLSFEYNAYFGDPNSPINFNVYELKEGLSGRYYTNVKTENFVDYNKFCGNLTQTINQTDFDKKTYRKTVRIKMSKDFLNRFFTKNADVYKTQEEFTKFFKGLYITTKPIGSDVLLNVTTAEIHLYYHYKYKNGTPNFSPPALVFPSTSEVVRANRIRHQKGVADNALLKNDTLSYIVAPSNYYTKVALPIKKMSEQIQASNKHLVVNSAILTMNIEDRAALKSDLPYVTDVLLIKGDEKDVENFFRNKSLPNDVSSFLVSLDKRNTSATTFEYFYSFKKLADLVQSEVQKYQSGQSANEELTMFLVPVKKQYSKPGSTTLTGLIPNYKMEATAIYSAKNKRIPMKMEVVYSGF